LLDAIGGSEQGVYPEGKGHSETARKGNKKTTAA
jgi:hypothetical protein